MLPYLETVLFVYDPDHASESYIMRDRFVMIAVQFCRVANAKKRFHKRFQIR